MKEIHANTWKNKSTIKVGLSSKLEFYFIEPISNYENLECKNSIHSCVTREFNDLLENFDSSSSCDRLITLYYLLREANRQYI